MAKKDVELLDELKPLHHNFTFIGVARVGENSFGGASVKEGKTWYHVNSNFGVETKPGNIVYPRIWGGYKLDNPNLMVQSKSKTGERITIPWESRKDEKLLKNVSKYAFFKVGIKQDEDGKMEYAQFISAIDFEDYLATNLKDGMEVIVNGSVEYSPGDEDRTYVNYEIQSVYLNREKEKDGETIPMSEHKAEIYQTYLADDTTLDRGWEKTLRNDGELVVRLYVPQYLSTIKNPQGGYSDWKKTSPVLQQVTFKAGDKPDAAIKMIKKYCDVKEGIVRESTFYVEAVDGYSEQEVEELDITKDMQELIDMGIMTKEEIKSQVTVRKTRVSENVFSKPSIKLNDEGKPALEVFDDKYSPEALIIPSLGASEDDEEESNEEYNKKAKATEPKTYEPDPEDEDDVSKDNVEVLNIDDLFK